MDRSPEHATSEKPKKEGWLCSVGRQCQCGWLAQRNAGDGRQLWHAKQERTTENRGNLGGLVNALGMRALRHRMGFLGYQESGTQPRTAWLPGPSKRGKTPSS